jgi:hypothetical protein
VTPVEQVDALRQRIRSHKSEIRRRRVDLARDKEQLVILERELASRGIKLVLVGEGEVNPWPSRSSVSKP